MKENFWKNIGWAVITLLVFTSVFSILFQSTPKTVHLSISELVQKINNNEVKAISVSGNDLTVDFKDNTKGLVKKEADLALTDTLKNYGVAPTSLKDVNLVIKDESGARFWASILIPTIIPLIIIIAIFWFMFRQAKSGMGQAFTFGKANLRLFGNGKEKTTFKDVAGLNEAKQELEEVVDFLKNPEKFLKMGARIPRGVLLMGAPGTGKTLLARAVAGEAGVPFFHISASEFVEMFVGVGASRTRDAFATAKRTAPAILFIDEIDAIGRERGTGMGGGHDEREQTLNQILVEMDGFDRDTRVVVLAATNRPDVLDPALLRPGRFDRRVMLDLPDIKDREDILKVHSKDKPLEKNIDFRKVAARTPGFSGADLANLMNESAIFAARKNKPAIVELDILNSIEKVMLGPERRHRVISEKEKLITAYHEAGHALVTASIKDADPVHKISIISRGRAGGYTLKIPDEDKRLKTKSQLLSDIATSLGGYVAEELVFGDISTGASSDLKNVSEIARSLVMKYGMSEKIGPISFDTEHEMAFVGRGGIEKNYSEELASKMDQEVKAFVDRAYKATKKILTSRRNVLDAIAKTLIEKETIEKEEFAELVQGYKFKLATV